MYSAIQQLVPPFFFDKGAIPFGPSLASCTPVQVLHDAENIGGAEMPNLSWSRCLCAEPCQNFVIQEVMSGAWISSLDFFNGSSYAKRASLLKLMRQPAFPCEDFQKCPSFLSNVGSMNKSAVNGPAGFVVKLLEPARNMIMSLHIPASLLIYYFI
jgi:hypothetical protein